MQKRQRDIAVCFPFKKEDVEDFKRNIKEALSHERVSDVLLAAHSENETYRGIKAFVDSLSSEERARVHIFTQERIGKKRPGEGDGMNTAIKYFVKNTDSEYLHFYDADIKSFNRTWIDRVQKRLDEGFDVARCFFPRAYTDAMVTWNITRTGFAYTWPHTILPDIEQPLGGELGMSRSTAEALSRDELVLNASDWSIDTALTIAFARNNVKLYEVYIREGKHHKLYGKLSDLETMAVECFNVIKENSELKIDTRDMVYEKDSVEAVPEEYKNRIAFDVEGTIREFKEGWTDGMKSIVNEYFPLHIRENVLKAIEDGNYEFMDPEMWYEVYDILMRSFEFEDNNWRRVLFKLWVLRVLNHASLALKDPDKSLKSLKDMVRMFRARRLTKDKV